ncbi:MAG: methyl-accepting chemotaxis protein [Acidimicrobiales bacterium]
MDLASMIGRLPTGDAVSDEDFESRHRLILWFLGLHTPVLLLIALVRGYGPIHAVVESLPPLLLAVGAWRAAGRCLRSGTAALGLVVGASILVHFTGGMIEAHFQWFVALSLIGLYVDVRPFLVGLAYTVLHHGGMSLIDPALAFSTPEAQRKPLLWTGVHVVFVLMQIGTIVANWVNAERQEEGRLRLASDQERLLGRQQELIGAVTAQATDLGARSGRIRNEIEQAVGSVAVIDDGTRRVGELARQATRQAEEAHGLSEHTRSGFEELDRQSRAIADLVAMVQEIASRTNLLALNASIEAARAGDAGKGFAVVASEVKNLAATTAETTQQITEATLAIQAGIEASRTQMDGVTAAVAAIGAIQESVDAELDRQIAACGDTRAGIGGASQAVLSVVSGIESLSGLTAGQR